MITKRRLAAYYNCLYIAPFGSHLCGLSRTCTVSWTGALNLKKVLYSFVNGSLESWIRILNIYCLCIPCHLHAISASHYVKRVCSQNMTHDMFQVILVKPWRVPHVGQEMLTLSVTPDFTHSWYVFIVEFVILGLCLRINYFGLFAWMSLNAGLGHIVLSLCSQCNVYLLFKISWTSLCFVFFGNA